MNLLSEIPRNQRPRKARPADFYAYDTHRSSTANDSITLPRHTSSRQRIHAYAAPRKPRNIQLFSSLHLSTSHLNTPSTPHATSLRNPNSLPPKNLKINPIHSYAFSEISVTNWPSRDPIGEFGGVNIYEYVGNDGVRGVDFLGMIPDWVAENRDQYDAILNSSSYKQALALQKAYYNTEVRIISVSNEFDNIWTKLRDYKFSPECCQYKIKMILELARAQANIKMTVEAIRTGRIKGAVPADIEDYGQSPFSASTNINSNIAAWLYNDPDIKSDISKLTNGSLTGYMEISRKDIGIAQESNDWGSVSETIFHEATHIGAQTIDDDSLGYSNNAHNLEDLYKSMDNFLTLLDTSINLKLPKGYRCFSTHWWK